MTNILTDDTSTQPPVDVHVQTEGTIRLITFGLSEFELPLPDDGDGLPHAELTICLPRGWQYDALDDPNWGWPVHTLRRAAKAFALNPRTLGLAYIYSGDAPDEPLAPNTPMTSLLFTPAEVIEFDGKEIQFYHALPLHSAERELAQGGQMAKLLLALANQQGSESEMIVDLTRASVVS